MADLTINIPDPEIPRIITAFKRILVEGEAVDLDNPTPAEISAKLKTICIETLKNMLKSIEKQIDREEFTFDDLDLT